MLWFSIEVAALFRDEIGLTAPTDHNQLDTRASGYEDLTSILLSAGVLNRVQLLCMSSKTCQRKCLPVSLKTSVQKHGEPSETQIMNQGFFLKPVELFHFIDV